MSKKVGFPFQKKPHQPVPFQGEAVGTKCVVPGYATIGHEFSISGTANRALYIVSQVKYLHDPQDNMCESLQIFPGNTSDRDADQSFHWPQI